MAKKTRGGKAEKLRKLVAAGKIAQALHIADNDVALLFELGTLLEEKGNHKMAEKTFDRLLQINPKSAEAWYNKGVALGNLGKYAEAVKCYEQALKIDPNDAAAWSNKGVALENLGKYDEVVKCFEQAVKIDPNDAKAWYNKGVALGNLGKYAEAVKCYEQAIKIDPNYAKAWLNKGVALRNLGKYAEAVKCYEQAIKIDPNYAEAYGNKGITFLNIREYDEAKALLKTAREIFSKKGMKKDANKAHKYELLATNASELMSRITSLDGQFINSLKSQTLVQLKEKTLDICAEIESVIKTFKKKQLPKDASELLESKLICFAVLSNALKFEKVDLKKLGDRRGVFEKWGFDTFVIAVNSLDSFIRFLNKYNSLEEIPKEKEEFLLRLLSTAYVLDGKLTEEISGKFKGEPYAIKPTAGVEIGKEPKIIYKHIADTGRGREWVRFCLVQLDFSLKAQRPAQEFGYVLNERDKIKTKVFKALEVAQKNKADVICFPELSFAKEWVEQIRNKYKDMIIIGGSYYEQGYNVCPIIINGVFIDPPYRKHRPSPPENPESTGRGMKSGNILYIFQTKCGRFSVLTCMDYTDQSYPVCRYEDKAIDFIINPCYDQNLLRFQPRCNSDCEDYGIDVIQVNKAPGGEEYGRTCIIGKEHRTILDKLIDDGFKPRDGIKYKLFELDSEMMIITDLNIRMKAPPVSLPLGYAGRIRISKQTCYKYTKKRWLPLPK